MRKSTCTKFMKTAPLILPSFLVLLCSIFLFSCSNKPSSKLEPYRWLLGTWEKKDGTYFSHESWLMGVSEKGDSVLLGQAFQVENGDTLFKELLSIRVINDSVYYVAIPDKSLPTKFLLKSTGDRSFSATNPRHDFPSTITYESPGPSSLNAKVSGRIRDHYREFNFSWTKVEPLP